MRTSGKGFAQDDRGQDVVERALLFVFIALVSVALSFGGGTSSSGVRNAAATHLSQSTR
jgi:Flp pilus assembly pilin Flp